MLINCDCLLVLTSETFYLIADYLIQITLPLTILMIIKRNIGNNEQMLKVKKRSTNIIKTETKASARSGLNSSEAIARAETIFNGYISIGSYMRLLYLIYVYNF